MPTGPIGNNRNLQYMIRNLLFPKRLMRMEYFWRFLLFRFFELAVLFTCASHTPENARQAALLMVLIYLAGLGYFIAFAILPRVKDAGLPLWILILFLVPYASAIPSLGLLFVRSRLP